MIQGSIARRYAKALLAIGIETKQYEAYGAELFRFAALMQHKELSETMANPSYALSRRKAVVRDLVGRLELCSTVSSLILLLTDRGRLEAVQSIAREYRGLMDRYAGRVRAQVTTAQKLSAEGVQRLTDALARKTGKQIILTEKADPELIAGMVTQIGSIVYDGSIRTRLEQMRQTLLTGDHQ